MKIDATARVPPDSGELEVFFNNDEEVKHKFKFLLVPSFSAKEGGMKKALGQMKLFSLGIFKILWQLRRGRVEWNFYKIKVIKLEFLEILKVLESFLEFQLVESFLGSFAELFLSFWA